MPTVASTSYGLVLPAIFGLATSVPLIIVLGLIWYFNVKGLIMKKKYEGRKNHTKDCWGIANPYWTI